LSEEERKQLAGAVAMLGNWKFAAKLCEKLIARYPHDPRLLLLMAKSLHSQRPTWRQQRLINYYLDSARQHAKSLALHDQKLLDEIEALSAQYPDADDFLDLFSRFGR
jgi:hypothetical protein